MNPGEFFSNQLKASQLTSENLSRQVLRLSVIRFSVFLVFLVALIWFANARIGWGVTATIVIFPLVFGGVVKLFNRKVLLKNLYTAIAGRYSQELERLSFNLKSIDGGHRFIDRAHPFSYDLDLFGDHSLFQLLNRTATPKGYERLADFMLKFPDRKIIEKRQEAVKELAQDPEWLVHLFSEGNVSAGGSVENLESWLTEEEESSGSPSNWVAAALSLVLFAVIALAIFTTLPYQLLFLPVVINILVLRSLQDRITQLSKQVSGNVQLLRGYERMIQMFQQRQFKSELLTELHAPFNPASVQSIRSLRKLLDYLNARSNLFFSLLDLLFLLDVYLLNGFTQWKKNNRSDLSQWFHNIAELEALGSMALHSYANPTYVFADLSGHQMVWDAAGIGHPLIPPDERVCNDFSIDSNSPVAIITGSNMSGKSTFLRTVGINSVLAYMGASVTAGRMELSIFSVFTAMRTEDNLSSHISSFYAELKRIKALLDSLDEKPTLCLLDEILKGTNTEDRHRGARGLLEQLSDANTAGLVSTHDLELGRWGETHGFANYSFNSSITGNEIHFDYRIAPGICHSFNASQLMKNMGIRLPDDA